MRLPPILFAARTPQKEHIVPFEEILPLRLKNRVSGKADAGSDVCCLHEMGVLFACLKNNEFVEKYCNKEIATFQTCYKSYMDKKFEAKKTDNQGIIKPGKTLNSKQLNKYLRRFPNSE